MSLRFCGRLLPVVLQLLSLPATHTLQLLPVAPQLLPCTGWHGCAAAPPARAAILACVGEEPDEPGEVEADAGASEEATLYKRKKGGYRAYKPKDDRDRLMYELKEVTPPPRLLGEVRLAPNLGCGDILEYEANTYVVKTVSYRYQYSSGKYRMVGKGANVVQTGRDAIEKALGRLLQRSPDAPPDVPPET